jgi:hypothetical protein
LPAHMLRGSTLSLAFDYLYLFYCFNFLGRFSVIESFSQ